MPSNSGTPWSEADLAALAKHYPDTPNTVLARIFRRSVRSIYAKANELGIYKTEAYLNEHGGRLDGTQGASARFQKGQTPWNKGKHFDSGGRSVETRFKKGSKPHTWRPIGTERITKDGYLQQKVTDTGCTPRDYRMVHHLVWEEHRGEIPPGHIVVFRDRNPKNLAIDNLECISRAENARRNTIHRYPPEMKELFRLSGRLKKEVRDREKQA